MACLGDMECIPGTEVMVTVMAMVDMQGTVTGVTGVMETLATTTAMPIADQAAIQDTAVKAATEAIGAA
ncbi:hypothetical protein LPJ57_005036, partial [Coemansia sp. RSA 486]